MKLIFINRFFHPDHSATSQMLSDLVFNIQPEQATRHVITSRLLYDQPVRTSKAQLTAQLPAHEVVQGVEINRVWTSGFGRGGLAGRAVDYASFYVMAMFALWRLARRGDIVIAKTDPPMLSVALAPIVALRRARQINWLQDIFPEVATALGMGRGRIARSALWFLLRLRNWSLRAAAMNVVLGDRMAAHLAKSGIEAEKIRIIPNWADGRLIVPRTSVATGAGAAAADGLRQCWIGEGRFVVAYSGNLGRAHEIETMLQAMMETSSNANAEPGPEDEIVWLIVGGGALNERLRCEVAARGLSSVIFKPYQPRESLGASLGVADVQVISLQPALEGLIVPSKLYGIAAAGVPAIFVGDPDGEVARILTRVKAGVIVAAGDGRALAAAVRRMAADPTGTRQLGSNARRAFDREFDMPLALQRWRALIAEIDSETAGQRGGNGPT